MKPDTKPVSDQVRTATQKEMANLKDELDDFIRRVPTLSQTELNRAKDKLVQKLGSTSKGAERLLKPDLRKKINFDKMGHSTILAIVAAGVLKVLAGHLNRGCSQIKKKKDCRSPCCWCKPYPDGSGHQIAGRCYDPDEEDCSSTEGYVCRS